MFTLTSPSQVRKNTDVYRRLYCRVAFFQGVGRDGDEDAYGRKSEVYRDLVTLLRNTSPRFAEDVRKQVMLLETRRK